MIPSSRCTPLGARRDSWQSEPVDGAAVLRTTMRQRRRAISEHAAIERADAAASQFDQLFTQLPGTLGSYVPTDGELDPRPVNDLVEAAGGAIYVPVCAEERLRFARYRTDSAMTLNRFSIPEPLDAERVAAGDLEVIVVPLVAFDRHGHRLGMGGGWYDRTFEAHGSTRRPLLIGFGHDEQELEELAPQSWDVTMDAIVTPTRAWWTDDY